jgi:hypothetical protein
VLPANVIVLEKDVDELKLRGPKNRFVPSNKGAPELLLEKVVPPDPKTAGEVIVVIHLVASDCGAPKISVRIIGAIPPWPIAASWVEVHTPLFMVPADVATTSLPDGAIVTTIAARAPPAVTKPAINTNTERKRLTATSKQYR